ncbi:hypothetical protein CUMW_132490, partial [Citrus unshiu]
ILFCLLSNGNSKCINEPASLPILLKGHMRCRMPATARFASSSAVASTSSSSGGFYSWLTGEQSTSSPSLDFPLPGICLSHPSSLPDYFYVDCGSIYESPISFVKTDLLERMAFRRTRDRSHLRVVRDMKAISKPHLLGSRWGAPLLLWKLMSLKWLSFLLMFAELCFSGFGACYSVVLANPLLAPECAISRLNSTLIKEFFAENYTAPWMVLAASRVEHDQLMLLGGGGSFSAGGPGKGVYSRLHRCVLNEIPHVQPFSAFSNIYNHPGIFGIQGTTGYDSGVYFYGITPGEVNQVQLDRAIQSTNSAILMNLESRIAVSEDIDRQGQTHGESGALTVEGVTKTDIYCFHGTEAYFIPSHNGIIWRCH